MHTLYDVETQVPAFIHVTEAKVNDIKAMDAIPYESGSYYVFDRAYNDHKRLFKIHMNDSFFVVRAKKTSNARTSNARTSNGNEECPRMYYQTVR